MWTARLILITLAALTFGCGASGGRPNAPPAPTPTPSIEYKLTIISTGGSYDASVETEFRRILDVIQAGGTCNPEPNRVKIADTMVAGWEQTAKRDTLLEYGQALASICG